jgi:hypothetical protein
VHYSEPTRVSCVVDMPEDALVQSCTMVVSVSSMPRGAKRASDVRALGFNVGRLPTLLVIRALWATDALTERRATEWVADVERRPETMPVV